MHPLVLAALLLLLVYVFLIGLGSALGPLFISFVLAYLSFPAIKLLERRGIKRTIAVPCVFLLLIVIIVTLILIIVPILFAETKQFLFQFPDNFARALQKLDQLFTERGYSLSISDFDLRSYLLENAREVSTNILQRLTLTAKGLFTNIIAIFLAFLNVLLIPLFFFYIINDFEKLRASIRSMIPRRFAPYLERYIALGNTVLSGYIRGQLTVAGILAFLYALGLTVVGLQFGLLIGLLAGCLSIIPYAGFVVGFTTAIMMALANFEGMGTILGIMFVFAIIQGLEGLVITPRLVGNKVGLSAFASVLSIIIAGNLFGFAGMLVAIPTAAIVKAMFTDLKQEYQSSVLYR